MFAGPTVYNYVHIGNARPPWCSTCCYRLLHSGLPGETAVVYARNVTDVDDKINAEQGRRVTSVPIGAITDRFHRRLPCGHGRLWARLQPDIRAARHRHISPR